MLIFSMNYKRYILKYLICYNFLKKVEKFEFLFFESLRKLFKNLFDAFRIIYKIFKHNTRQKLT